jgi:hypothetical protein
MATENQENKSRRTALNERMLSKYPDLDLNDDEAVSGRISDDFDEYDRQLGEYKEREQSLTDMMSKDPRSANFLNNWRQGGDPVVEFVREYGRDALEHANDPEVLDEIAAANKDHVERVAKNKELEEEFEKNFPKSMETLDQLAEEKGWSEEHKNAVMEHLSGIFHDALIGKYSRENLIMASNAINHDEDVATAAEDAEVKGRNAKIDETLRKRNEGDGVSALDGANNPPQQKRRLNIFDYADAAK